MPLKHLFTTLVAATLSTATLAEPAASLDRWHADIGQGYRQLAGASEQLASTADAYCTAPGQASRDQLLARWREAFLTWQAVRFVDFGPVEQDSLASQFQFWPDPKNLVARKAGYYLSQAEPVTPQDVDDAGVAVQGFPMLEYLLFDSRLNQGDQAPPAAQACRLLKAVSGHLAENAANLAEAWSALKERYLTTATYGEATVESGMAAISLLEERRLGGPMGLRGTGKRSVYGADAWRSGQSLAALRASLQGLQDYYLPGLGEALEASGHSALAERIRSQFEETLARFDHLPDAMAPLLADARFGELQGLYVDLSQLASLLNDQAGPALGVIRGFNASDGD